LNKAISTTFTRTMRLNKSSQSRSPPTKNAKQHPMSRLLSSSTRLMKVTRAD
jgi:hypothetical protein